MAQSASRDGANGYEQYFGFHQTPFSLAPDVRFRFQSGSHAAALAQVRYALERREPVVVVTGDIGTGKTLLCRTVIEQLDSKTFLSIINDPLLSRDDLLKRMLEDFGMLSKDRASATPVSRHDLIHALQEFLATVLRLKAHAAVVIDEAQHVQPDVLEHIRLLSNIQDERGTALQIILVGQTDLEPLLSRPELRQLRQRVSRRVRLDALSQDEVALYIRHRLAVARQRPVPSGFPEALAREFTEWEGAHADTTFTTPAAQAVAQESGGIPRVVNLICDRALESAYSEGSRTVDTATIASAVRALGLTTQAASATAIASPAPSIPPPAPSVEATAPAIKSPAEAPETPLVPIVEGTESPGKSEPIEHRPAESSRTPAPVSEPLPEPSPEAVQEGSLFGAVPRRDVSFFAAERQRESPRNAAAASADARLSRVDAPQAGVSPLTEESMFGTATKPGGGRARLIVIAAGLAVIAGAAWFIPTLMNPFGSAPAGPSAATTPPAASPSTAPAASAAAPSVASPNITTPSGAPTGIPPTQPPAATSTPRGVQPPGTLAAAALPPTASSAGAAASSTDAAAGPFEIVIASFRTASRAADVAAQVTTLGQPVRLQTSGAWQQVLAGPYASRAAAADAQDSLARAGLTGTQLVPAAR